MSANVMLVDDSATVRLQARRALSAAGFGIIEATDGVDALEKLESAADIALIVCDVNMPRMSGIEFVENLARRAGPRPPVIMLTTEGHPNLVQSAKACGAKGWMIKPFKPEVLVAAAKKLTGA
ncbi:MAG TPA: response regulator [Labilithrix sp.]|jgi:two-component system chemotaxis response regulator CheY|nr:response regulator [Labilithrix sp.]